MAFQRFRGPNGVFQMIALLETGSSQRREHLMRSLTAENPAIASLVKTKVLTLDHILTWSGSQLRPLVAELDGPMRAIFFSYLHNKPEKLRELGVPPETVKALDIQANEQTDAFASLIVIKVRELERIGIMSLQHFDIAKSMFDSFDSTRSRAA